MRLADRRTDGQMSIARPCVCVRSRTVKTSPGRLTPVLLAGGCIKLTRTAAEDDRGHAARNQELTRVIPPSHSYRLQRIQQMSGVDPLNREIQTTAAIDCIPRWSDTWN